MLTDIKTILWKEWRTFQKSIKTELSYVVVLGMIPGVIIPVIILKDPLSFGLIPPVWVLAVSLLYFAAFYAGLISERSFAEERDNDTLRTLLITRMPSLAIFLGKWLSMLIQVTTLVIVIFALQSLVLHMFKYQTEEVPDLMSYDMTNASLAIGFCVLASSYMIAANAFFSLVVKGSKQLRQVSILPLLPPMLALWAYIKLFGVGWKSFLALGFTLFLLTVLSFFLAVIAFRSEKVRL